MNNKNNNYEKGSKKTAHENKNVILDRELYKNESQKKAGEEEGEEEDRHKHGKGAQCGCKYF